MTARETLVTTLTHLFAASRRGRMDSHRAEAERLVDAALRERAHELANQIRAHARTLPDPYGPYRTYVNAAEVLATHLEVEAS
jgi:hypothetical protein